MIVYFKFKLIYFQKEDFLFDHMIYYLQNLSIIINY